MTASLDRETPPSSNARIPMLTPIGNKQPASTNTYQPAPNRHRAIGRKRSRTPPLPPPIAVTMTAATEGPKLPVQFVGNEKGSNPREEAIINPHSPHEYAHATTKNEIKGWLLTSERSLFKVLPPQASSHLGYGHQGAPVAFRFTVTSHLSAARDKRKDTRVS